MEEKLYAEKIYNGAKEPDELMALLRNYRDAKQRFDTACNTAGIALQERESAGMCLQKLSDAVIQAVNRGMTDPTVPQPAQAIGAAVGQIQRGY